MPTICRRCGAAAIAGARFCRRCGTPLEAAAPGENHAAVPPGATPTDSPIDQGIRTEGPAPEDARRANPETARINPAELGALLRQSPDARLTAPGPPSTQTGRRDDDDDDQRRGAPTPPADFNRSDAPPDSFLTRVSPARETFEPAGQSAARADDALTNNTWDSRADEEEELTVVSPPRTGQDGATFAPGQTPATRPSPSNARMIWLGVGAGSALLLCALAVGAWFAFDYVRRPVAVTGAGEAPPIPVADAKQLFDEKMVETEALLASGELEKALASLREANRLDPANTRAHWRLGELLMESGRRREAIEEYRAVTRNDPSDRAAWRVLASAQFAENAHQEAAESYRRLLDLTDKAAQDPNDLLAYADALRLSGRADEARAVYQELSATVAEAANIARARLAEMTAQIGPPVIVVQQTPPPGITSPAGADESNGGAGASQVTSAPPTPAPTSAPPPIASDASLTPGERFNRAVELWASNRPAAVAEFRAAANGGSADAYYYLGLSIAEGRDPGTLNRAELVAAMSYFQAARRGRFGPQAQRYEAQLGEEYDRRKNQ